MVPVTPSDYLGHLAILRQQKRFPGILPGRETLRDSPGGDAARFPGGAAARSRNWITLFLRL